MAKRKTRTAYRDKDTGRFVSAGKWRRSRSHGGTRYARTKVPQGIHRRQVPTVTPTAPPLPTPGGAFPTEVGAGRIPQEFLEAPDDFFESGYEAPEEEEYA